MFKHKDLITTTSNITSKKISINKNMDKRKVGCYEELSISTSDSYF
ncbi:hypothetical protein KPL37_02630 [Clostridium frigoris]|uniref:Uncharacterized protein n=1 Tax=Clostridium frigoris TaxID=205327 RepID=A0ABS6BQD0_9CLOT|nr:hypothetical protein [Clostridium frigoris]MBU3158670.1 hypothetical protein [Clostridium frigoris]